MKKNNKKQSQISLENELIESSIKLKQMFKNMYGRDIEKDAYVFWNVYNNQKAYDYKFIQLLRETNVPEDLIYAYYKTGRLLTDENVKNISKSEIKEFEFYCKEYNKLIKRTKSILFNSLHYQTIY